MHEFFARSCGLRKMKAEISRIGKNFEARFSPPICTKSKAVCTRFTGRFLFNTICPNYLSENTGDTSNPADTSVRT